MNRLSKIFLVIIIILVIALGISIHFCMENLDSALRAAKATFLRQQAITDAGLKCEIQEDGSYKLVERTEPIETSEE